MFRAAPLITLCVALAGCQFIPGTAAQDTHQAEDAVRYNLDDPGSANFRNERIVGVGADRMVCGEVNAKNRMGAYVGFRPYAYVPRTNDVGILPESDGTTKTDLEILDFPKGCYPSKS